jgi:hypothetical protein
LLSFSFLLPFNRWLACFLLLVQLTLHFIIFSGQFFNPHPPASLHKMASAIHAWWIFNKTINNWFNRIKDGQKREACLMVKILSL